MISAPSPECREPLVGQTDGASTPVQQGLAARACMLSRELLADGEIILLELKPSPWFIPLVSAPVIGFGLLVLMAGNLPAVVRHLSSWGPTLRHAGLWIIALRVGWAMLQWLCRVYVLTDRRIIRRKGVLTIQLFECGLDRVQNTFIQRTLVQRILSIGNIYFATAGTGQVEAMWQHIRNPNEVHREITNAISRFQKLMRNSSL